MRGKQCGLIRDKLHFIAWDVINTSAANHCHKKDDITDDLKSDAEIIEVKELLLDIFDFPEKPRNNFEKSR